MSAAGLPETMRAVMLTRTGSVDESLHSVSAALPEVGDGEILVRVDAAGVNYADVVRRLGRPYPTQAVPPYILGAEAVGRIVAVGASVAASRLGERVLVWPDHGCYAEYVTAPAAQSLEIADDITSADALGLCIQGLTAWGALTEAARLRPGERVLVWGGAGGVGSIAIQLAVHEGASAVLATGATATKRQHILDSGATPIDPADPAWTARVAEEGAIDVVLLMSGGDAFQRSQEVLAPGGRIVVVGAAPDETGDATLSAHAGWLLAQEAHVMGFFLGRFLRDREAVRKAAEHLFALVRAGELSTFVDDGFDLDTAGQAHVLLETRSSTGKLVLRVAS